MRAIWPAVRVAACAIALLAMSFSAGDAEASTAGLVIRHGDGAMTYAIVVFPEESISAFDLLERSGISLATVAFGGLGNAVCTLDGEGCGLSDCRVRLCQTGDPNSPFWQYFRQDASGAWVSQPLGANAATVHDGDVDGWSWTEGDSGLASANVASIASTLGIDLAALDSTQNQAFTGSFDADGNPISDSGHRGVSIWSSVGGIVALMLLAGAGILVRRRRMRAG